MLFLTFICEVVCLLVASTISYPAEKELEEFEFSPEEYIKQDIEGSDAFV